jgi:D-glycero-D-manno-heptose 1,7-bisphosphate phosphatase
MGTARRAVVLDRDGVINRNIFNPATGGYEAPLTVNDFALLPGVRGALQCLRDAEFLLFIVSNQPNYAKRKSSLVELFAIHAALHRELTAINVAFAAVYYCLHHPNGDVPRYLGACACRKPSPYFLLRARREFGLDFEQSWMVGDRAADILCGRAAGVRTILIGATGTAGVQAFPDRIAPDLVAAADIICGTHLSCNSNPSELAGTVTAKPCSIGEMPDGTGAPFSTAVLAEGFHP